MDDPHERSLLLPAGARLLHIGPPKTGTSTLQSALAARRDELPEHGAAYPGIWLRWPQATREVVGEAPIGDHDPDLSWRALKKAVREQGELRTCVSNEIFARARRKAVRTVVRGLGGDRVHVVLVARELGRLLTSQWQERVKQSARADSFDVWLRDVLDPTSTSRAHKHFRRQQDLAWLIGRWATAVDGRVTVVIGDEREPRSLLAAVEAMLGLPDGMLEGGPGAVNRSLSHGRLQLLRDLDREAAEREWPDYARGVRPGVVRSLSVHPHDAWETTTTLPEWSHDAVRELNVRRVDDLRSSGARIVGDPTALLDPPRASDAAPVDVRVPTAVVTRLVGRLVDDLTPDVAPRDERGAD